jgi:uncharacterized cupin superfamily protein
MSRKPKRPDFIVHRAAIEAPAAPPNATEDFGFASELSAATGINHLRVAHLRIPPGLRAYPPLAMDDLEIFAFVMGGTPDLWLDGYLYSLKDGDGVSFHAGAGDAHSLINNGKTDAHVFVISEAFRRNSRVKHHRDDTADEDLKKVGMFWAEAPRHKLGPNSGKPGDGAGRKRALPAHVSNWRDILDAESQTYPNSTEHHGIDALFGRRARFSRIGIHFEVLKPGRRTSWPHAERDEEEFVYVVKGDVDVWTDGHIDAAAQGDFIGWKAGTGITHVVINNGDADAWLLVGGEASRTRNQFWYPFHSARNKEIAALYWADHPKPKLGPHDGLPDALRAKLPKAALRSPAAANEAAQKLTNPKKTKKKK